MRGGVADRPNVDAGTEEVRARLDRPAILVNSAGLTPLSLFLEITAEMWNYVPAVNLASYVSAKSGVVGPTKCLGPWTQSGFITGQIIGVNGGRNTLPG